MKLKPLQIIWMLGVFALLAGLILDIAGVINPSNIIWFGITGALFLTSRIMPPLAEIRRAHRRG